MITINLNDKGALKSVAGRTAIITGGSSGIGYATAQILSQNGCNVVLGDLEPPAQNDEPSNPKTSIHYRRCNITDWASLTALFAYATSTFGQIDIVHANAGVNDIGDPFFVPLTTSTQEIREPNLKTIDVNFKGTVNTVALGMHHMKNNPEGGSIVMTASLAGYFGTAGMPLYTASKHALVGLLRALAEPALASGIALSLVAPGMTETPLLAALPGVDSTATKPGDLQSLWARLRASGIPSQGPEIVAQTVCYLARTGREAAGQGVYVQGSEAFDIEKELALARPPWLSKKMGYLLQDKKPVWEQ